MEKIIVFSLYLSHLDRLLTKEISVTIASVKDVRDISETIADEMELMLDAITPTVVLNDDNHVTIGVRVGQFKLVCDKVALLDISPAWALQTEGIAEKVGAQVKTWLACVLATEKI